MINEENLRVVVIGGEEVKTPVYFTHWSMLQSLQREAGRRPPPLCASEATSSITAARILN